MKTRVEWIDAGKLPADGSPMVTAPTDAAASPADRYRKGGIPVRGADRPISLIFRLDGLNSPDKVQIRHVRRRGRRIEMRLSVKRFSGLMGANVVRTVLIEIELGVLAPGDYELRVAIDTFTFSDWDQPETARFGETEKQRHTFTVVP